MIIDNKKINFKISTNGKFQLTGCKTDEQALSCVKNIWNRVKDSDVCTLKQFNSYIGFSESSQSVPVAILQVVMANLDFNVGFIVNRENLDRYLNKNTEFNSLLETSFGYTGVNIKIRMEECVADSSLTLMYFEDEWVNSQINYRSFLNTMTDKERIREEAKVRHHTFLVFHSGTVIMSGMDTKYMEQTYKKFTKLLVDCRRDIEEYLE
jgi:TATA-box binding protein (TBP) (component of TFIID and TFIIIB)